MWFLCIFSTFAVVHALDNGAASAPPLGWQSWNGFGMNFNATLFLEQAVRVFPQHLNDYFFFFFF